MFNADHQWWSDKFRGDEWEKILQAIKYHFLINSEAKYGAVIVGLKLALKLKADNIEFKSDSHSHLVILQVVGTYKAQDSWM